MKIITRSVPLFLIVTTLIFVTQVSALSPVMTNISSSDIGSTAVISGLPEGTDVQLVLNNGVPIPMKIGSDGTAKYLVLLEGTLQTNAVFQGKAIDNFSVELKSSSTPPSSSGSGSSGSSSGGTYPTITATSAPTTTLTVTPIVTTVKPTITTAPTETAEFTETATPIPTQKAPGFGVIATIVAIGLIGTIYILRKMK